MIRRRDLFLAFVAFAAPGLLWFGRWSPYPLGFDAVSAVTPGHVSVVGAASTSGQGAPESPTEADLVHGAVYLSGGLHKAVDPDAEWVLVRPGHGEMDRRAVSQHVKVVHALVEVLADIAPEAEISLLLGGVPGTPAQAPTGLSEALDALSESSKLAGVKLNVLDLAQEESEEAEVPDGGLAADVYPVPIALLEADALVNVARFVGGLSALDNLEGLAGPAPDSEGDGRRVDLALLSDVDYTLVDMLGHAGVQGPLVLAGQDGVAVDRVAAAIAGIGSIAALQIAGERQLGRTALGNIKVAGLDVPGSWVPAADTTGSVSPPNGPSSRPP